jgi:hypothetical protein
VWFSVVWESANSKTSFLFSPPTVISSPSTCRCGLRVFPFTLFYLPLNAAPHTPRNTIQYPSVCRIYQRSAEGLPQGQTPRSGLSINGLRIHTSQSNRKATSGAITSFEIEAPGTVESQTCTAPPRHRDSRKSFIRNHLISNSRSFLL